MRFRTDAAAGNPSRHEKRLVKLAPSLKHVEYVIELDTRYTYLLV